MNYSLKKHFELIESINNDIDVLINEQSTPSPEPEYESVKVKYTVLNDGEFIPNEKDPVTKKDKKYMYLQEAKTFDPTAQPGDIIEVETVEWHQIKGDVEKTVSAEETGNEAPLDIKQVKSIGTLAIDPKNRNRAMRVGKYAIVGVPRTAAKIATPLKTIKKLIGKEIPHSICWCASLFEDNSDPSGGGVPDRPTFETDIADLTPVVQKQLLEKWDKCKTDYWKKLKKPDKRKKILGQCGDFEGFTKRVDNLLNKIISELGEFYVVKGYEKEDDINTKGGGVASKIAAHRKITINFDVPGAGDYMELDTDGGSTKKPFTGGGDREFKISGIHKAGGDGKTVLLSGYSERYVMSFRTAKPTTSQAGNMWLVIGGEKQSKATAWEGTIVKYKK
jgi:hypothetical protein